MQGKGPVAQSLRELAPGDPGGGGAQIIVDGLGGTVDGEPFYAITPLALVEVTGEAGERAFEASGCTSRACSPLPSVCSRESSAK